MHEILSPRLGKVGAIVTLPDSVNVRALEKAGLVRKAPPPDEDPPDEDPPKKFAAKKAAPKDGE